MGNEWLLVLIWFAIMWWIAQPSPKTATYSISTTTSKGELRLGQILQQIYPDHAFIHNYRPDWLRNTLIPNGRNLELDYYCEELKLGAEFQGKQHYEFIDKFHVHPIDVQYQIAKDRLKVKLCKQHGVKLLVVPYWEYNNMHAFVHSHIFPSKNIR